MSGIAAAPLPTRYATDGNSQGFTLPKPGEWMDHASCATLPPEQADQMFFPTPTQIASQNMAKQFYCGPCPVKTECLTFGMTQEFGMYGGQTPYERFNGTSYAAYIGSRHSSHVRDADPRAQEAS